MSFEFFRYPRTRHLEGSRLQPGDEDLEQVPYRQIRGRWIVVEEKLDGSNLGLKVQQETVVPQSRGHDLTGGPREKHFELLKTWVAVHHQVLLEQLGDRYIMFGEWMRAKHTVYYDRLPHYFQEFDVYDRQTQTFLDTPSRQAHIGQAPIVSVPVLYQGPAPKQLKDLLTLIRPSLGKSPKWREALNQEIKRTGCDFDRTWHETLDDELSEGLYIKVEEDGRVTERLKWVRPDFLQTLQEQTTHWAERRMIHNQLADGVDLFAPKLTHTWNHL